MCGSNVLIIERVPLVYVISEVISCRSAAGIPASGRTVLSSQPVAKQGPSMAEKKFEKRTETHRNGMLVAIACSFLAA
jgi:hypothetical protein